MSARQWAWTPGGMVLKKFSADTTYNRFVDSKDYLSLEKENAELRARVKACDELTKFIKEWDLDEVFTSQLLELLPKEGE